MFFEVGCAYRHNIIINAVKKFKALTPAGHNDPWCHPFLIHQPAARRMKVTSCTWALWCR